MKISALIPAKGFTHAKQRLATLLAAAERAKLAEAMLRDVLSQVVSAQSLGATFVVTGDAEVSQIASTLGAHVIREPEETGETDAVTLALGQMKQRGIRAALVIPADIPLIRSEDLNLLVGKASDFSSPFAVLVPSHDRMGTNALLLSPPDVIELRFGYDSFSYHLSRVASKELPLRVVENERIALDIDEPQDLKRFLSSGQSDSETYRRLSQLGVLSALQNVDHPERL